MNQPTLPESEKHPQRNFDRVAHLAEFFHRHPNEWIDELTVGKIGGSTRVSDLGRAPYHLHLVNRQRHVELGGETLAVSEFKFVVEDLRISSSK